MRWSSCSAGVLACASALSVCAMAGEPPKSAADKPAENAASPWIIGEPIRYANLTVFPISSRTPRTQNRFITLDEGLKAGTVTVVELGADRSERAERRRQRRPQC